MHAKDCVVRSVCAQLFRRVWAFWVSPPCMPRDGAGGWMVIAPHEGSRESGGEAEGAPLHGDQS
eukprot:scaffold12897_cov29-Tisochrysis_lutea.AAC.3